MRNRNGYLGSLIPVLMTLLHMIILAMEVSFSETLQVISLRSLLYL